MVEIHDYQIVQRKNGCADIIFSGALPEGFRDEQRIYAHVVREDDNLTVIGWTLCEHDESNWQIRLTLPEGGLYRLEACLRDGENAFEWSPRIKNVCHVGVGELYMITGQSNMAGYGRDAAYDPPRLGVHLYGNNGKWSVATHPLNDSIDTIYPENCELPSGTSPALSFGRVMSERLGVPVGLVQASLGGSPLSAWHPNENGYLYRAMMRRIDAVGEIGGVIWYQGCSDANTNDAPKYLERFAEMVRLWREQLGNIPVITVQLNRWTGGGESDRYWGMIREAQRMAAKTILDVCVVPSIDMLTTDGIHNSSSANVVIGERMASAALCSFYGKPGMTAPSVEKIEYVDDTHIYVVFGEGYHVSGMDGMGHGMNIEDADGLIECPRADMYKNGMLVSAERKFTLPAKYHALWKCSPPAFVPRDMHGMPMLSCYGIEIEK